MIVRNILLANSFSALKCKFKQNRTIVVRLYCVNTDLFWLLTFRSYARESAPLIDPHSVHATREKKKQHWKLNILKHKQIASLTRQKWSTRNRVETLPFFFFSERMRNPEWMTHNCLVPAGLKNYHYYRNSNTKEMINRKRAVEMFTLIIFRADANSRVNDALLPSICRSTLWMIRVSIYYGEMVKQEKQLKKRVQLNGQLTGPWNENYNGIYTYMVSKQCTSFLLMKCWRSRRTIACVFLLELDHSSMEFCILT